MDLQGWLDLQFWLGVIAGFSVWSFAVLAIGVYIGMLVEAKQQLTWRQEWQNTQGAYQQRRR